MPTSPVSAAGWRIEPPVSVPVAAGASARGDGRGRAARRAARHAVRVATDCAPGRSSSSRSTSPSRTRPCWSCRASRSPRPRAARRRSRRRARRNCSSIFEPQLVFTPCGAEDVLVRDGDAGERAGVTGGERPIGGAGLRDCLSLGDGDEAVELPVVRGDAREAVTRQLLGGKLARVQRPGQLGQSPGVHVRGPEAHAATLSPCGDSFRPSRSPSRISR
mgnify:CR=1 FL=1